MGTSLAQPPPSQCTLFRGVGQDGFPRRTFSSVEAAATESSAPNAAAEQQPMLYMWGMDDGNTKLLKPDSHASESVLTVPTAVDWTRQSSWVPTDGSTLCDVVCGPTETAWLFTNGQCFVMGDNKHGQLGLGHANPVTEPTRLELPHGTGIRQVSFGVHSAAVVDTQGDLYTMGFGGSAFTTGMGWLGQGGTLSDASNTTTTNANANRLLTPTLVESLVEDGCLVDQVHVGELHMTVLTTEGEVLTTGAGSYGRLGNFETTDQLYLEPVEVLTTASRVTSLSTGKSFTLALTEQGVLYSWGRNHKGQLGTGLGLAVDIYAMQAVPEPVPTDEWVGQGSNQRIVQMHAGHSHAACLTAQGQAYYWGMSLHYDPTPVPFVVDGTDDHDKTNKDSTTTTTNLSNMVQVACGEDYTLAVDHEGHVYSWGIAPRRRGASGRSTTTTTNSSVKTNGVLGQGSTISRLHQATRIPMDFTTSNLSQDTKPVVRVSAGWNHAACWVLPSPTKDS